MYASRKPADWVSDALIRVYLDTRTAAIDHARDAAWSAHVYATTTHANPADRLAVSAKADRLAALSESEAYDAAYLFYYGGR